MIYLKFISFYSINKTCNKKFKILLSYVSLWWLLWCEQMVCELILSVAQGAYRRLVKLFHLSWVDQWMMTQFNRDNLDRSSQEPILSIPPPNPLLAPVSTSQLHHQPSPWGDPWSLQWRPSFLWSWATFWEEPYPWWSEVHRRSRAIMAEHGIQWL